MIRIRQIGVCQPDDGRRTFRSDRAQAHTRPIKHTNGNHQGTVPGQLPFVCKRVVRLSEMYFLPSG